MENLELLQIWEFFKISKFVIYLYSTSPPTVTRLTVYRGPHIEVWSRRKNSADSPREIELLRILLSEILLALSNHVNTVHKTFLQSEKVREQHRDDLDPAEAVLFQGEKNETSEECLVFWNNCKYFLKISKKW